MPNLKQPEEPQPAVAQSRQADMHRNTEVLHSNTRVQQAHSLTTNKKHRSTRKWQQNPNVPQQMLIKTQHSARNTNKPQQSPASISLPQEKSNTQQTPSKKATCSLMHQKKTNKFQQTPIKTKPCQTLVKNPTRFNTNKKKKNPTNQKSTNTSINLILYNKHQ